MPEVNFGTHSIQEQKYFPELQKKEETFHETEVASKIFAGAAGGIPVEKKPLTFKGIVKLVKEGIIKRTDKLKDKARIAAPQTEKISVTNEKNEKLSAKFRSEASQIMLSEESFADKSHKMNELVKQAAPKSYAELRNLMSEHPDLLLQLKEKGWGGLKKELHEAMAKNDSIRCALVKQVINLALETMKVMGYDPPGSHSDYGTPGWNSDIDSPYFADKKVPEAIQVVEKSMFDMIVYENFGGLPGFIFDTETYTQQAGGKFETQLHIETIEGEALFSRIELASSMLQKLIQTGGTETQEWQNFKEEQLAAARSYQNSSYEAALNDTFADLENMHQDIQKGIQETLKKEGSDPKDPVRRQMATMGYKMAGIYKISAEIDATKQKLDQLTQENKNEKAYERDVLRVKIAQLDLMRTSFYDEGYLTQGAFRTICFLREGQIHQRKIEKQQELIYSHYQRELDKYEKEIIPWSGGFKLNKTQQMKATALENFSSMSENLAMYLSHFRQKAQAGDVESLQRALLETSKYGDRVIRAAQHLINAVESGAHLDSKDQEKVATLKKEIQELVFIFSEQEKVKRANFLNYASTEEEMLKALHADQMNEAQKKELKEKIKPILEVSEPGGIIGDAKYEESITPQDRYVTLFAKMVHRGLMTPKGIDKNGDHYSDNPRLDLILKARCGFSPTYDAELYQQLLAYHQGSPKTTLRAQNLTTSAKIKHLQDRLNNVTNNVANLVIAHNVIHTPQADIPAELKLSQTWQSVNT